MTPVSTPISIGNTSLVPRVFVTRYVDCSSRSCILKKSYAQKLVLPLSTSLRLFPSIKTCSLHRTLRTQIISYAAGTDTAIEETDSLVVDKDAGEQVSTPAVQPRRAGQGRRSEMPPVKNEDLVAGASFAGKVRSIQPFGAFIDFGAFTDGLVHVSQLSNSFVKDVNSVVSIGQEVTVRLVDANFETGRISLSMKDEDDKSNSTVDDSDRPARTPRKSGQRSGGQKSGSQRREKQSKFVQGQLLVGTVKSVTRSGAFITLPEGEEGFLPSSEEADSGLGSMMLGSGSSLEVGQEVDVWVLKIARGVTLTMKKESENEDSADLTTEGTIYTATNPFLLAFRQNQKIATFLDEREKELQPASNSVVAQIAAIDQKTEETESTVDIENKELQIQETPIVENVAAVDVIAEETQSTIEIETEALQEEDTPSVETVAAVDQKTEETDSTVEIESREAEKEVPSVENVAVVEKIPEDESTVEVGTEVKSEMPSLAPEDSNITSSSEESTVEEIQINEVVENQTEVKEEVPSETPQNAGPVSEQIPEEKPAKAKP